MAGRGIGGGLLVLVFTLALAAPAEAQISIVGEWAGRYHEDQTDRVPGDVQGDFTGVPMNDAARRYAESYDVRRVNLLEHQCEPYNLPHIYRGPLQFRVWEDKDPATQEVIAYKEYLGTYMQYRTIWMDGRPLPPEYAPHTFMGFSTGQWNGDTLTVRTTHIKKEFYRRSGIPSSDLTTVVEHYIRHGNLLSHVMIVTDPVYLSEPFVNSQEFVLMERGNQNWLYNCEYVLEVPTVKDSVPHYLPGKNPFLEDYAKKFGLPLAAVWGGAETTYPEYQPKLALGAVPAPSDKPARAGAPPRKENRELKDEIETFHVQGNVYMLVGAEANVAVQIGDEGVLVVDTGAAATRDKVLAAIRKLSQKPIRWIVNTSGDSIVYFRGSDVLVAGDLFLTTTFPVIDEQDGGGVDGFIAGLNKMLEVAVPKYLQEGGTYAIPGHGRVGDEADIVEYRDMVVIIRDRIQDMVKRGMTLEQVRAARPTLDYDGRYGAASGARFVEAVYKMLAGKSK